MRGKFYKKRRKKILLFLLVAVLGLSVRQYGLMKLNSVLSEKLYFFTAIGGDINVGHVSGGIFRDITLRDVAVSLQGTEESHSFDISRVDLPYRLWHIGLKKFDLMPRESISVLFAEDNSFLTGKIEIKSKSKAELVLDAEITPLFFAAGERKRLKGIFKDTPGGYDYEVLYDDAFTVKGFLDPGSRKLDLLTRDFSSEGGMLEISLERVSGNGLKAYARADKISVRDRQVISDLWAEFRFDEKLEYDLEISNLLIDKRPMWDVSGSGSYDHVMRVLDIRNLTWGESLELSGNVDLSGEGVLDVEIISEDLDIEDFLNMFPLTGNNIKGALNLQARVRGDLLEPNIDTRMRARNFSFGETNVEMIFLSFRGDWPDFEITDGRIVEDGGVMRVEGVFDAVKLAEGERADGIEVYTDNRMALWRGWHINKDADTRLVEASKDNFTFSTQFEDDRERHRPDSGRKVNRDLGFEYKLDGSNSIKMDFQENRDFLGFKHRMEF